MMLIVLFCGVMFNAVNANGGEKKEKNDELYTVKKEIERKIVFKELQKIKNPTFEDRITGEVFIEFPLFKKVFSEAELIIQISGIYKPTRRRLVAKYKGNYYGMRLALNILYDQTKKENKASIEDRIKLYFLLGRISVEINDQKNSKSSSYEIISIKKEERKTNEKGIIHDYRYKVQVMYDKEITDYIFYIENDHIKRIEYFNEGKYGGSLPILQLKRNDNKRSRTINFSVDGINIVHKTIVTPTSHTYEHYYIKVSDDALATNDTIRFQVSGLTPLHPNTKLQIIPLYGYSGIPILDQLLVVDSLGMACYTWMPLNNNQTGFMEVKVNVSGSDTFWQYTYIIPEHAITDTFSLGYDYTIHFCNQFFAGHTTGSNNYPAHSSGIDHASIFAGYVENAITESWNKQVNDWQLALNCTSQGFNNVPIDGDGNYEIFINDSDEENSYHGTNSTYQDDNSERIIGVTYDIFNDYPFYTSEENLLKSVICHEFYHGIQWSLNNGWGGKDWDWMIEGQARFIQTLQYPIEEFDNATTQHFYRKNSNMYLEDWLNRSLITNYGSINIPDYMSYNYCLFWRSLYENYTTTGSTADSLEIIRETCRGNIYHTLPIIKLFMDSKLNSFGGDYNSMEQALIPLAKNSYFNNPSSGFWSPNPSNNFYDTPNIETINTLTNDLTNSISINNAIESSFGIDYQQININDNNINAAAVELIIAEEDSSSFALQIWSLQNDVIIDSFSVVISDTLNIASETFRTKNTANKLIVNVFRLDAYEFDSIADPTYTLNVYPGTFVSGAQSGNWTLENSPYLMNGDINVPTGQTLNIGEGVSIFAMDEYGINVYGTLNANGIEEAGITFTAVDTTTGWRGLRIYEGSGSRSESQFNYTTFEYAINYEEDHYFDFASPFMRIGCGGAIFCFQSSPTFDNCIFRNCKSHAGGAMYLMNGSSVDITNSEFYNNTSTDSGGAILICNNNIFNGQSSFHTFRDLLIYDNTTGIYGGSAIYTDQNVEITAIGMTVYNNFAPDNPYSTFYYGASFFVGAGSFFSFYDGILRSNQTAEVIIWENNYSCFFGAINSNITNGDACYAYVNPYRENNQERYIFFNYIIDADPMFVDDGSFNLQQTSLCIDGGGSYDGSLDPDGTIDDIGFGYYHQPLEVPIPSDVTISHSEGRNSLTLNWSQSTGAIFYKLYASNNPNIGFVEIDSLRAATFYNLISEDSKKFYYVTSGNNRGRTQIRNYGKRKFDLKEIYNNLKKRFK